MMALKSEDAGQNISKADGLAKWLEMDLGGPKDLIQDDQMESLPKSTEKRYVKLSSKFVEITLFAYYLIIQY